MHPRRAGAATHTPLQLCDGTGSCQTLTPNDCSPYACGANDQCRSTCSTDSDCADGHHCSGTACVPKLRKGFACPGGSTQCLSGFCVDGVCCENACDTVCYGCASAKTGGAAGECLPVADGIDPDDDCDPKPASTCKRDGMCDGAGDCRLHGTATVCAAESCSGSIYTPQRRCNGAGGCAQAVPLACAPYSCDATEQCRTTCALQSDCSPGYVCAGGNCVATKADGSRCSSPAECASGFCNVEGGVGFCCDQACAGLCQSCHASKSGGRNGTCAPIPSGQDPDGECPAPTCSDPTARAVWTCSGAGTCSWAASPCAANESCTGGVCG